MDISKYPPSTQLQRVDEILRVLFGAGPLGVTTGAIAKATKLSASYVTQQLAQMAHLGWAEEVGDTGRWRPGVGLAQKALALQVSIQRDMDRLNEYQQRITRT